MTDFAVSIAKWVAEAKERGDASLRMIASDALSRVKELTPVRSGYLRANWQASFDDEVLPVDKAKDTKSSSEIAAGLAGSVAGGLAGGKAGAAIGTAALPGIGTAIGAVAGSVIGGLAGDAVASGATKQGDPLADAKVGDKIFILNPVAYARRIEYGFSGKDRAGRTVDQPGRGMVRQTVAEMPQIADRALARLPK